MKPAITLLQKALYEIKHLHGHTFQAVTKESGVHNLQKIVDGEIEPTPDSWWKLHKAFPKYIPEPVYVDGQRIYKNIVAQTISGHSNVTTGDMTVTNNHHKMNLSPEKQTLINLLREKDPRKIYLRRCIAELCMREDPEE